MEAQVVWVYTSVLYIIMFYYILVYSILIEYNLSYNINIVLYYVWLNGYIITNSINVTQYTKFDVHITL